MKNEIRKSVLKRMKSRFTKPNDSLYERLFKVSYWKKAKVIAVTMSTDFELDTMPIIKKALLEHKKVVIPKTFSHRIMKFYEYQSIHSLIRSRFGILEPIDNQKSVVKNKIDLIIVPGVAFSQVNHQRIGYGGGFYDYYLKDYYGTTVSLVRRIQLVTSEWPTESTDIAIQHLIIEEENHEI